MTQIEDRLRSQLPELADALVATDEASTGKPPTSRRGARIVAAAAAVLGLVVLGAVLARLANDGNGEELATTGARPTDFGDWSPMADAPISARPYAIAGWTGTEFAVWAGSNLDRNVAFADGAFYDPAADAWSSMPTPRWGHPGLTGVWFDGDLFVAAKGSGHQIDLDRGAALELPSPEGFVVGSMAATDDAIWIVGPVALTGYSDLAVARLDPSSGELGPTITYEIGEDQADLAEGILRLETQIFWSGEEIIFWHPQAGGVAFTPADTSWRPIDLPAHPTSVVEVGAAAMTDQGLVVVAGLGESSGVAVESGGSWKWVTQELPAVLIENQTAAGAGDWVMIFGSATEPIAVHLPSGSWEVQESAPTGAVVAPNTAWTGNSLIVWGGVPAPEGDPGAFWTPPDL